jgi:hypothetical protein
MFTNREPLPALQNSPRAALSSTGTKLCIDPVGGQSVRP